MRSSGSSLLRRDMVAPRLAELYFGCRFQLRGRGRRARALFHQCSVIAVESIGEPRRIAVILDRFACTVERFAKAFVLFDKRAVESFSKALRRLVPHLPMRADKSSGADAEKRFGPAAEAGILHVQSVCPTGIDKDQRLDRLELPLIFNEIFWLDGRRSNGDRPALFERVMTSEMQEAGACVDEKVEQRGL